MEPSLGTGLHGLRPYQQTALRSIDERLAGWRVTLRRHRPSVRRGFADVPRNLLTGTRAPLKEDAKREREQKSKRITETIQAMDTGGLPSSACVLRSLMPKPATDSWQYSPGVSL